MIPSNWRNRLAESDAPFLNVGDDLISDLGDLVGAYYVETVYQSDFIAERLWFDALTLDAIRLDYATGKTDAETARLWYDAGRRHLADAIADRVSRRMHA